MSAPATTVHQHQPQSYYQPSSPTPAPGTPQNVQRSQSTRTPHSRQPSTVSRTSSSANRDRGSEQAPPSRRDTEYSSGAGDGQPSSSGRRPDHSRQSSNMSELDAKHSAPIMDEHGRPIPPKTRKTTIQGITGTWILGKTIGAGSMGKVKIAKNQESGEQCAIKIVPRAVTERDHNGRASRDESKEIRTAREAAIVTLLDHPYICGMRDVVRTNNHWYMCFEYVNGGQMLDYIISHGRLKEKQARKFARQIASSLDYCHRNSIVHRDLKIENILISKTGDIKIIDFGLSNLFSPRSLLNTFCGSLYFAAPELLQARPYTGPEVDIWSFGIVLYVLVCGKVPFDDQSMPALHAKIKRGVVDYPAWLSADCKSLLSRMLVTDPRSRATLAEIMNHPWVTKGAGGPPDNYLPHRDPIQLPLDQNVVMAMTGFEFGSPESIAHALTRVIESEDYQSVARAAQREASMHLVGAEKKKPFQFDFYKRRSSTSSKDTLTNASSELLAHPYADTLNAYHPLLSIYHLVREKQERDHKKELSTAEASTAQALGGPLVARQESQEKALQVPVIPVPEVAHTSESSYEVSDETTFNGGRTRPRARTHGDEEMAETVKKLNLDSPTTTTTPPIAASHSEAYKRESTAAGLLRRLSTRKYSTKAEPKLSTPPTVNLQPPSDSTTIAPVAVPRKSLSVRRTRDTDRPVSVSSTPNQQYLTPPTTADGASPPERPIPQKRSSKLGRSTSVSEVDRRKRVVRTTSDASSDHDVPHANLNIPASVPSQPSSPGSIASRAKSLGHARRESYSHRRSRREETESQIPGEVPEENDADLAMSTGSGEEVQGMPSIEHVKPIFLKGLLSVSTTTSKPPVAIRADIMRVLDQLGVKYKEIRGGFQCKHTPSIDLKSVIDNVPQSPEMTATSSSSHRRKISFGGDRSSNINPQQPPMKIAMKKGALSGGDMSSESVTDPSSTQIQSELGGSMVLQFEIYIVRVPLMNLYGIQQKKLSGNTWSYKNMMTKIISELRL